jgi:hypothetical protein
MPLDSGAPVPPEASVEVEGTCALTFSSAEARGGSTSMASAAGRGPPPGAVVAMWGGRRSAAGLSLSLSSVMGGGEGCCFGAGAAASVAVRRGPWGGVGTVPVCPLPTTTPLFYSFPVFFLPPVGQSRAHGAGELCFCSVSRCQSAALAFLAGDLVGLGLQPTIPDLERIWPSFFLIVGALCGTTGGNNVGYEMRPAHSPLL